MSVPGATTFPALIPNSQKSPRHGCAVTIIEMRKPRLIAPWFLAWVGGCLVPYHNWDRKLRVEWKPVKLDFGHVELEVSYSQMGVWIKCLDLVGGVEGGGERGVSIWNRNVRVFFWRWHWVIKRESIELGKEFSLEPQGLWREGPAGEKRADKDDVACVLC